MRAAERALGANSAHAPRLKGATVRSVRRFLGSAFPRGSCAFQAHVLFADAAPSGVAAWGYFCSAFHAGTHVWGRRHSCRFSESARKNFSLSFKLSAPVSARFRGDFRAFPWLIRLFYHGNSRKPSRKSFETGRERARLIKFPSDFADFSRNFPLSFNP